MHSSGDLFGDPEDAFGSDIIHTNPITDVTVLSAEERELATRKSIVQLRRGVPIVERWHKGSNGLILPESRRAAFEALFGLFQKEDSRQIRTHIRSSSWTHLLNMTSNEEDLTKVVGLMSLWTGRQRAWRPIVPELFVRTSSLHVLNQRDPNSSS